jgi:DNA-binding MarR family transcriptional regulator
MQLDLDNYVPGLLLWLSNKIASSATQVYRSRFGIGVTDWRVLAYFEVYPWTTASSACELMGLDKAAVSRSIALLVENGWLQSRPSGLRKVEYRTTKSGKTFHDEVLPVAEAREEALLEGISKSDRARLIRVLHQMLQNLPAVSNAGVPKTD